jgi:hypothetical protein
VSHTCRSDVPLLRRFLAVLGGSILAAHGLAHLIGVASLSELFEPSNLRYGHAVPTLGTVPGYFVGALWLVAAALFVIAGAQLIAGRGRWATVAVAGVALSTPVMVLDPRQAVAGLVVNAFVVGLVFVWWRGRTSTP